MGAWAPCACAVVPLGAAAAGGLAALPARVSKAREFAPAGDRAYDEAVRAQPGPNRWPVTTPPRLAPLAPPAPLGQAAPLALLVALATACGGDGGSPPNLSPKAALTGPQTPASVGVPVDLDASASTDADGYIESYLFTFADGTPAARSASPGTSHSFGAPGHYLVSLTVTDDDGATSTAELALDVTAEPPPDCPGTQVRCAGVCVDTYSDEAHCGDCTTTCEAGETCDSGSCTPADPCPGAPIECGGTCVDPTSDPDHCGDCDTVCEDHAACVASVCADPPGTVLETLPAPPFDVTRGLTTVPGPGGTTLFYEATGRRFTRFDPKTGDETGDSWFVNNENTRRSIGLCAPAPATPQAPPVFRSGGYSRFGDPRQNVDLERYTAKQLTGALAGQGGPCAPDGAFIWVYHNEKRTLTRRDAMDNAVQTVAVTGLAADDWFTDLALDGQGHVWLTRPEFNMFGPLLAKVDLATGMLLYFIEPPHPAGLGGIELVGADLWGIGAGGTFRMVP